MESATYSPDHQDHVSIPKVSDVLTAQSGCTRSRHWLGYRRNRLGLFGHITRCESDQMSEDFPMLWLYHHRALRAAICHPGTFLVHILDWLSDWRRSSAITYGLFVLVLLVRECWWTGKLISFCRTRRIRPTSKHRAQVRSDRRSLIATLQFQYNFYDGIGSTFLEALYFYLLIVLCLSRKQTWRE